MMKCHEFFRVTRSCCLCFVFQGETSAGKSSLMNLILGEELLPHSPLCTTSVICELRYGRERKIVAHFKDREPETGLRTKTIHLEENREGSTESSYLEQIKPFVHSEKGSIYKKIEVFWPHQLLEVLYLYVIGYIIK